MMELLKFKDTKAVQDIVHLYDQSFKNNSTAIVIDNGRVRVFSLIILISNL